ncbi:MAG: hypothetical protein JJP05_04065 [cyanobacterium endosymbiont of Rhopalodia gibba]
MKLIERKAYGFKKFVNF